ncbi:MAG: hypothetical protein WBP88_06165 [Nitrososphaeraceae archaeon]
MSSAIRYTGPSGPDPDAICPVCNKLLIITYPNRSREAGVAFQCPYCYEWLRVKVSSNKPSNLSEDEAKRWQAVEIIRLDKAVLQKNTDTEIFKWET